MTSQATHFSDTCNCGPGYYFEQANDEWTTAQYDSTGAKDSLYPCQQCPVGTYKSPTDLQDKYGCIPCSAIVNASAKADVGDAITDTRSFQVQQFSTSS